LRWKIISACWFEIDIVVEFCFEFISLLAEVGFRLPHKSIRAKGPVTAWWLKAIRFQVVAPEALSPKSGGIRATIRIPAILEDTFVSRKQIVHLNTCHESCHT